MLYDGAIKFCHQGLQTLDDPQRETSYNALVRAQRIVLELTTSLNHKQAPELCERLSALYTYIYRRLVDANFNRDAAAIQEAIKLLEFERETWVMLMKKLSDEGFVRTAPAAQPAMPPRPAYGQPGAPSAMSSLSVRVG
jgi:flagellar protein FliS